jgi:hypothetical protein
MNRELRKALKYSVLTVFGFSSARDDGIVLGMKTPYN